MTMRGLVARRPQPVVALLIFHSAGRGLERTYFIRSSGIKLRGPPQGTDQNDI